MQGSLDVATWTQLEGWAFDPAHPDTPVELELLDNGVPVLRFHARQYRADLQAAGLGSGHCAFFLTVPEGWSAAPGHTLQVRSVHDGTELVGSPVTLARGNGLDPALRRSLTGSLNQLGEAGAPADREAALRTLVEQADAVLRARAETGGPAAAAEAQSFFQRWGSLLVDLAEPLPPRPPPRPPALQPRTLVITAALSDASAPAIRPVLRGLSDLQHEINLVAADAAAPPDIRQALETEAIVVHAPPHTASVEEALRRQAGLFDVVLLLGVTTALDYGALTRRHMRQARLLLWTAGLASLEVGERAAAEPDLLPHAQWLRTQETMAAWSVDAVLTASADCAAEIRQRLPQRQVHLLGDDHHAALLAALRHSAAAP